MAIAPHPENDAANINYKVAILCSRITARLLLVLIILGIFKK
jgi:hypothetical protein